MVKTLELGSSRSCGALLPDNLVSAIKESKLLVQTSAGRLMQEGEEQSDAEKDGDFSDLEHEEVRDGLRGNAWSWPSETQAGWPSKSTNSAPAQAPPNEELAQAGVRPDGGRERDKDPHSAAEHEGNADP